jgi:TonB family protein
MEVKLERDLLLAVLIAVVLHAGAAVTGIPPANFRYQVENEKKRGLEITFVSAYRKAEETVPPKAKSTAVKEETGKKEKRKEERREVENRKAERAEYHRATPERRIAATPVSPHAAVPAVEKIDDKIEILPAVPRYLECPPPRYPPAARRRGYEGTVVLSVYVLTDGTVGDLMVKKSSGHAILDGAASKTVEKWAFEPASEMGKPLSMWVDVPIRFVFKEGD